MLKRFNAFCDRVGSNNTAIVIMLSCIFVSHLLAAISGYAAQTKYYALNFITVSIWGIVLLLSILRVVRERKQAKQANA
jgi:hypothetical protein